MQGLFVLGLIATCALLNERYDKLKANINSKKRTGGTI